MATGQKIIQKSNRLNRNQTKDLSIQISLSGLSFCILNRDTNTIELLKYQAFEKKRNPIELLESLKKTISSYPELSQSFALVTVIYQNELSALVPKAYFDEEQMANYLKFNSKILASDFISYDEIAANESVNVYVPYMNISNFIFDTYGAFEYKHAATILIDTVLRKEAIDDGATVFVNLKPNYFELIAVKERQLLLCNSFEYFTNEDVLYYLMFALEQLRLSPESVKLKLTGQIAKDAALFEMIYTYVRFVELHEPTYTFGFSDSAKPVQAHQSYIILNSF